MRVGRPRLSRAGEQPIAYAFSRNANRHVLLAAPAAVSHPPETSASPHVAFTAATAAAAAGAAAVPAALFRAKDSPILSALQLEPARARFALLPRHAGELRLNALLHAAAGSAEFGAEDAACALGTNVVAFALPAPLASLLAAVDGDHLYAANLELLALVGEDEEDNAGYEEMSRELEPGMWRDLEAYIARRATSPAPPDIMHTVEELLRMSYQTPWHVPVSYLHIAPNDVAAALCDLAVHRDRRTVGSGNAGRKEDALWHLFLAWLPVREALVHRLGMPGRAAATALLDAEAVGDIDRAWARTGLVVAASRAAASGLFSLLPEDLVTHVLAPHVLLACLLVPANSVQLTGDADAAERPLNVYSDSGKPATLA